MCVGTEWIDAGVARGKLVTLMGLNIGMEALRKDRLRRERQTEVCYMHISNIYEFCPGNK